MKSVASIAIVGLAALSQAQPAFISEIFVNPVGADNGKEYFEIQGLPGQSLAGYYLVQVDGDGAASGGVDQVLNLSSFSLGANGLFLWRDSVVSLFPTSNPQTTVFVQDFTPDLENGSQTWILGTGTPPLVGDDIDVDNDGIVDNPAPFAGFTAVDAVSMLEEDGSPADDFGFGAHFGGFEFPNYGIQFGVDGWTSDILYRVLSSSGLTSNGWVSGDILGDPSLQPMTWELTPFLQVGALGVSPAISGYDLPAPTPGSLNLAWPPSAVVSVIFSGTIVMSNSDSDWSNEMIELEVYDLTNTLLVYKKTFNNSVNGVVSLPALNIPNGSYNVRITGDTFLTRQLSGVAISPGAMVSVNVSLINGDIDANNEVGPSDFSALSFAFGTESDNPEFDSRADLDDNGEVGPSDFAILSNSFGQEGD